MVYRKEDRYSRHALFYTLSGADPEAVQTRLAASRVIILGCGGIGNQVSCTLATAGVGHLTLIDEDRIEISNLTRQILFTEEDLGQSKTAVLRRELLRRGSNVAVEVIETKLSTEEDFAKIPTSDLIVVSADSSGLIPRLNAYAVQQRIPYLPIGYIQDIAVWGPFVIPGKTGCFACQKLTITASQAGDLAWSLIRDINGRSQAPSVGPVNMLAAAHGSLDILRYLGGFGEIRSLNQRVGIWTHDLHIDTQPCPRNAECSACGGLP